ncbi:MAG: hypothetical protein IKL86_00930 [Clostridia bacterium]|nr:hypothetical protein [Clostridia bacterium]
MKKYFLLVLLSLLIVATGVCTLFGSVDVVSNAEETTPSVTYIETEQDFLNFVTNRYFAKEGDKFILTSDIYLKRFYQDGYAIKSLDNYQNKIFNGIFDGRGHTIVGLKESLFSTIGTTGVVKDVQLIGINNTDKATACSLAYVNNGTIDKVQISATLKGSSFTAGMVANNAGTIQNSIVISDMTGADSTTAYAIANHSTGSIVNSYGAEINSLVAPEGDLSSAYDRSKIQTFTELNLNLSVENANGEILAGVNLHNEPLFRDDNIRYVEGVTDSVKFFNTDALSDDIKQFLAQYAKISGGSKALDKAPCTFGTGTKEDPFQVSTPEQLNYITTLPSTSYAMLTANLDFTKYDLIDVAILGTLSCHLDGNGHIITLPNFPKNITLFEGVGAVSMDENSSLYDSLTITDLYIHGSVATELRGYVYNINCYNHDSYMFKETQNTALIMRSTIVSAGMVASSMVEENIGMIAYSRAIGTSKFVINNNNIYGCYYAPLSNDGIDSFVSDSKVVDSVVCAPSGEITVVGEEPYIMTSFGTADEYGFGYTYGVKEDIVVPVFPSDNIIYKQTLSIADGSSVSVNKGENARTIRYTLSPLEVGSDVSSYVADGYNDKLYYDSQDSTKAYELLGSEGATISKAVVEYLMMSKMSSEISAYLSNRTLNWAYQSGTDFNEDMFVSNSSYTLTYQDDVIYLNAKLVVDNDGVGALEYSFIEDGVGTLKVLGALNMLSLASTLEDLGIEQVEESDANYTHPLLKYKGVQIKILDESDTEIIGGFVSAVGSYRVMVYIPSTLTTAGTWVENTFNLQKGTFDLSNTTLVSSVGGLSQATAPTFSGSDIVLGGSVFTLDGTLYQGITITANRILSLRYYDGTYAPQAIGAYVTGAGQYSLELLVSIPGYNDSTIIIDFYVARKELIIDTYYGSESEIQLPYYSTLELDSVEFIERGGSDITELKAYLGAQTTYKVGSNVGTYDIYALIDRANPDYNFDYDFDVKVGNSVELTINAVAISLEQSKLSKDIIYDGYEHEFSVSSDAIITNTADTTALQVELQFFDKDSAEAMDAPKAKNVGLYEYLVKAVPHSTNYLPTENSYLISIEILPLEITLKANDSYVNYGEDALYSATIMPVIDMDLGEDISLKLVEGVDYVLGSEYEKNVTVAGAKLDIIVTIIGGIHTGDSYLVGNYIININNISNGTLTVGKKSYVINMVDSYEYTGSPVALDLGIDYLDATPTYKFYMLSGGNSYPLDTAPINACDSTFLYQVEVSIPETNAYYGLITDKLQFAITQKDEHISGLYVLNGGVYTPLSDLSEITYDKTEYTIGIKYSELVVGTYAITYKYRLATNDGTTYDYTGTNPIALTNAIAIKDISVEINGGQNYRSYTFDNGGAGYTFTIKPRAVALPAFLPQSYRGTPFTEDEFNIWVNELSFLDGKGPIDGDEVTFYTKIPTGVVVMNPTSYSILVYSNNPNYHMFDVDRPEAQNILSFTISTRKVIVSLDEVLQPETFEYGQIARIDGGLPYIERNIKYSDDENTIISVKLYIDIATHQDTFIAPGKYDILKAEYDNNEELENISFEFNGGVDKIIINPLKVTFNWSNMLQPNVGLKESYTYSGTAIDYPKYFNSAMVYAVNSELSKKGDPDVQVSLLGGETFKHAGSYTFEATTNYTKLNDEGVAVNCYEIVESARSFTSVINKKDVVYSITPVALNVGDSAPSAYEVKYQADKAPISSDTLSYAFTIDGFDNSVEGDYAVNMLLRVKDGGKLYDDYNIAKLNPDVKEVSVRLMEFDSTLICTDYTTTYTGSEVEVPVAGLPEGAVVHYSLKPIIQGSYAIRVTVTKTGYRTKVFDVTLVINKATPYIEFTEPKVMEYDVTHTLSHSDVNAIVTYKGMSVVGRFEFEKVAGKVPPMKLGEHTYTITFIPDSINYNIVSGISYTITTFVEKEEISVMMGEFELGESIEASGEITISVTLPANVQGAAFLIVNGSACLDGKYTFTESEKSALVEVMLDDQVLYSKLINVTIEGSTPSTPPTDTPSDTPSDTPTDTPSDTPQKPTTPPTSGDKEEIKDDDSNLGLIIGLSVGGGVLVIGGVALTIILVKKKGGRNG